MREIKVFFSKKYNAWEHHIFKNDFFNMDYWREMGITPIFIYFDENTDIQSFLEDTNTNPNIKFNILAFNHAFSINKIKQLIDTIKPVIIFHLSEESRELNEIHNYLINCSNIYFHQYKHANYEYSKNCFQIPLCYVSNFCSDVPSTSINNIIRKSNEREYDASFIGQMKSDREEMCSVFQKGMGKTYISSGITHWHNPELSKIKPNDMFTIYNNSKFVLIGRGNGTLDCFRIYEAIVAGALPVVVALQDELNITFDFDGNHPIFITADTWEHVLEKCKKISLFEQDIIRNFNLHWWKSQILKIQQIILREYISSFSNQPVFIST